MSSEILMASEQGCPIEMHHITIPKCDEMYDKECTGKIASILSNYRVKINHSLHINWMGVQMIRIKRKVIE